MCFFCVYVFLFVIFWYINHVFVCCVCVLLFKHFYLPTFAQLFLPQYILESCRIKIGEKSELLIIVNVGNC